MLGFGVGEVMAAATAFKAFKGAVDAIKSGVSTANDIRDIASQIDTLLDSKSILDRAKNKKAAPGSFSLKSIASDTIDARIADENLQEIKTLINLRFGSSTFQDILDERKKRIKEYADAEKKRIAIKAKRRKEMMNDFKLLGWIVGGSTLLAMAAVGYYLFSNQ